MDEQLTYYVDKTSGTAADTLLAVGFAQLLGEVLRRSNKPSKGIVLQDAGTHYKIQLPAPITASDLQHLEPFSLIKPLVTDKHIEKQGPRFDGFDYQGQQEISAAYYEKLKKLPPEYRTPQARANKSQYPLLADIQEPDSQLGHYRTINQMKIASSFNELAQRWIELGPLQREHVYLLFMLFGQPQNDLAATVVTWQQLAKEHDLKGKALVTALQIVNATTGKGANRTKSSILAEGNQESFWLLELLKFVGFMDAAAPYVVQGGKDRKTYVLQPKVIELSTLQGMMREFRAVCWSSTVVKLDIMASLRFAQTFIKFREQALKGQAEDDFLEEEQIYSVAHGFETTFYKDMGSAFATMNVSAINFPQWLPHITTLDEAETAQIVLREHLQIIQQIRMSDGKEGAEEYELLRFYRDFLSGRDLKPFWKFTTAYSGYLISQREGEKNPQRRIRQFTTTGLENLFAMNNTPGQKRLSTITGNAGFKRIAYAIRQSTVKAQYRRSQLRDRTYEVRYGLGQELMREARYSDKFIAALSRFLQQYNAETAREEEKLANRLGGRTLTSEDRRSNKLRGSVAYSDIDEIASLIDDFGSEQVCSLLVAYGYASDPRKDFQDGVGENVSHELDIIVTEPEDESSTEE